MESALPVYRTHPAYGPSILLHGAIVLALVLGGWFFAADHPPAPQVFQLVAGAGDNYLATQATALGSETAVKFDVPKMPMIPTPAAPQPQPEPHPQTQSEVTPQPVQPVPLAQATAPVKPAAKTSASGSRSMPNFVKSLKWAQIKTESAYKMHQAKLKREQERQRRIAERKAALAAARNSGLSFEQFEKQLEARGKSSGVMHGASMDAGANGKALTAEQQDAMLAWSAMLSDRWRDNFESLATFPGNWKAHVSFYVSGDGAISNIHLSASSGNPDVDHAILEALRYVKVPPPPTRRGDTYNAPFSSKGDDEE